MFNLSNQEKITIFFLLIIIVIVSGVILYRNFNVEDKFTINPPENPTENNSIVKIEAPPVIIHITGAVNNPGVYQLKSTDRIIDAVKIAGGATEEANLDAVNLALRLKDGQKIVIPHNRIVGTTEGNNIDSTYTSSSHSDKININTANSKLLQSLPGIGPVLSERIVEYRNKNGFFSSIDDIKNVSGIGEKKFEGIKDLICAQ